MITTAPQIGFDRFIQLDWLAAAINVRTGQVSLSELNDRLDAAGLGEEARAKTRTKLNALCLEPRPELTDFADRGLGLCKDDLPISAFGWGMAIASYPFFGKVAEFTGRLISIQGDCSSLEIHRRMSEVFGDREITKRATQAVLQTQADWGAIERVENGKRLMRRPPMVLDNEHAVAWLIEAALRYTRKPVPLPTMPSMAVIYPFVLDHSLAYVVSNSLNLELRSEGPSNQFITLRQKLGN